MSFGRQKNMVRRASRADEDYHRSQRRRGVDRAAMLESRSRRGSRFGQTLRTLFGLLRRR